MAVTSDKVIMCFKAFETDLVEFRFFALSAFVLYGLVALDYQERRLSNRDQQLHGKFDQSEGKALGAAGKSSDQLGNCASYR
jgi:hypothetical protein